MGNRPKDNIFRVSQKYEVDTADGEKETLKVVTTYNIVHLPTFKKNVGVGKKLKEGFGEANADVVLNFCKEKFGESISGLKEVVTDEMRRIDFLNELYDQYDPFIEKYGLKVSQCEFRYKTSKEA